MVFQWAKVARTMSSKSLLEQDFMIPVPKSEVFQTSYQTS